MSNVSKAKQKLSEALKMLPGDFALSTTRQHMVNALKSITKYEEKSQKRKDNQLNLHKQYWGEIEAKAVNEPMTEVSPMAVMKTLNYLDNMINQEMLKIEQLNNSPKENVVNSEVAPQQNQSLLKD